MLTSQYLLFSSQRQSLFTINPFFVSYIQEALYNFNVFLSGLFSVGSGAAFFLTFGSEFGVFLQSRIRNPALKFDHFHSSQETETATNVNYLVFSIRLCLHELSNLDSIDGYSTLWTTDIFMYDSCLTFHVRNLSWSKRRYLNVNIECLSSD